MSKLGEGGTRVVSIRSLRRLAGAAPLSSILNATPCSCSHCVAEALSFDTYSRPGGGVEAITEWRREP